MNKILIIIKILYKKMCYPVKCEKCGKTTWSGCGNHKDMIMSKIPENERCNCPREEKDVEPKKSLTSVPGSVIGNFTEIKSLKQFESIIKGDILVVADFYATWCGPCNAMAPIVRLYFNYKFFILQFAKVSKEINNAKFIKVNSEENEEIIDMYEINAFPTFGLFKKGQLIDTKIGRFDDVSMKKFIKAKL